MEQQRFVRKNTAIFDAQRRQEKKRNRRTVFYVFLFFVISVVFLAVCAFVFLNVDTININGSERYTNEEILEYVPINKGENIFAFDAEEIETNLLQNFPYIGSVEIVRDLPSTVEINIVENEPYFAAELAGDTYLFSSDLKVLDCLKDTPADSTNLTAITLSSVRTCIVGKQVEFVNVRTFDAVVSLYQSLADNFIDDKIRKIDVRSRFDIYLNYDNRFEVYVGDTEDIDIKIRFLVAIIDKLQPDATGTIDVSNPHEASVSLS